MRIVRGRKLVYRTVGHVADFFPRTAAILASLAAIILAAACTAPPSRVPPSSSSPPEASAQFRACYAKTKKPWLVDMVTIAQKSDARLELLIGDFVGGTAADRAEARRYLLDRRAGRYADTEEMAGRIFGDCIESTSTERYERRKTVRCYKEQAIIFQLLWMKSEGGLTAEQASAQLRQIYGPTDEATEAAIKRLTRDAYLMLRPGSENASIAFSEAQFQVCLTIYP
jgi:hypothetical protein